MANTSKLGASPQRPLISTRTLKFARLPPNLIQEAWVRATSKDRQPLLAHTMQTHAEGKIENLFAISTYQQSTERPTVGEDIAPAKE